MNRADGAETSTAGQPDLAALKAAYEEANEAVKKAHSEYERLWPIYWAARTAYRNALAESKGEPTEEEVREQEALLETIFGPLEPIIERQDGEEVSPNSFENGPAAQ